MSMAVQTREYRAEARFQRVSPQKARLVLELIKGRGVQEALDTAAFTKKRIAPVVHKLLTSAIDNAKYVAGEEGIDLDVDNLYVKKAMANDGPRMKRIRPAPMGRAYRYQRRLTHIILSVAEREATSGSGDQGGGAGSCAGAREGRQGEEGCARGREEAGWKKDAGKKTAPAKTAKQVRVEGFVRGEELRHTEEV